MQWFVKGNNKQAEAVFSLFALFTYGLVAY